MIRGRVDYELLDHTADTGIIVRAESLPALFERAASAMFDVMVDVTRVATHAPAQAISVESEDLEALLVAWLGELLSRAMAESVVFGAFEVQSLETGDGQPARLVARVWGEPLELERHRFRTELKAVTYHHLRVARDASGWSARVVFDQ